MRKWSKSNRLALNNDKTNFVIFHSSTHKLTEHIVLKIGKKKIKHENHVRFLGVLLDSNLSWRTHLNELSKNYLGQLVYFIKSDTMLVWIHLCCSVMNFCTIYFIWCVCLGINISIND